MRQAISLQELIHELLEAKMINVALNLSNISFAVLFSHFGIEIRANLDFIDELLY
jgi:hypothetical protein